MDLVAGLLEGPRARRAFLLRSVLAPPFGLRISDEAPLTVLVVVDGSAVVSFDDGETAELRSGDVAIVRGPDHYTVGDRAETVPQIVIGTDQRCTTIGGVEVADALRQGVRTWGNAPLGTEGAAVLLTGTYTSPGELSRRLLDVMPRLVVVGTGIGRGAAVQLLIDEMGRNDLGQEVVLDRLLDLVLVDALRTWFARPDAPGTDWYGAHGDEVVGPALRLLDHDPRRPWTVASLASEVGVSRAALARRFHDLVGQPPMTYLAERRLSLAADLLGDPAESVGGVAHQVGYNSPFTFSAAFKRHFGSSPTEHRSRSPRFVA